MSVSPILYVDDDPQQLQLFCMFLHKLPYSAITAENSEQAWNILQDQKPALVFLDIAMPGISGLELMHMIRHDPNVCDTKIVILTARPSAVTAEDAASADRVLVKPISRSQLIETIGELLAAVH